MRILCLHGFLGSPKDFDFLKDEFDIIAPDLSAYVLLDYKELQAKLSKLIHLEKCHFLGYSFGARLGARLFSDLKKKDIDKNNNKLVCMAGHLGIKEDSEREDRLKIEKKFIEIINNSNEKTFLDYWNQLHLFKDDLPLVSCNYINARSYFENYALSEQPFLTKILFKVKEQIYFFYGENDQKYTSYAKSELTDFKVEYIEKAGHRLIKQHEYFRQKLREIL